MKPTVYKAAVLPLAAILHVTVLPNPPKHGRLALWMALGATFAGLDGQVYSGAAFGSAWAWELAFALPAA